MSGDFIHKDIIRKYIKQLEQDSHAYECTGLDMTRASQGVELAVELGLVFSKEKLDLHYRLGQQSQMAHESNCPLLIAGQPAEFVCECSLMTNKKEGPAITSIDNNLQPYQRGDEICLECKQRWDKHRGISNNCPTSIKTFVCSGRIDVLNGKTTEIHNHYNYPPSLPRPLHKKGNGTSH